MIRRYRMPFATNDPAHPEARVPAHKMDILRPNGVGWTLVGHDEMYATIEADVTDIVHNQLAQQLDVEVLD